MKKQLFILLPINLLLKELNQLTGHSPYIGLLFTGICKIMQILLIKKVWGVWNSGISIIY